MGALADIYRGEVRIGVGCPGGESKHGNDVDRTNGEEEGEDRRAGK